MGTAVAVVHFFVYMVATGGLWIGRKLRREDLKDDFYFGICLFEAVVAGLVCASILFIGGGHGG